MKVTVIPTVDPAVVRMAAGFHPRGTWYSPRKQRPQAFKALQGNPSSDIREERA